MKKKIYIASGILAIVVLIQISLSNLAVFENWELMTYDLRENLSFDVPFLNKFTKRADKDIVIVALDDYSKKKLLENPPEEFEPWPWPRDSWNNVINFIEQGNPKTILFDMVFENLNENKWHDRRFAQELRSYNNIVLGTYLDNPKVNDDEFSREINVEKNDFLPTAQPLKVNINNKSLENNITFFENAPVNDIYSGYNTIGVVNKVLDKDNSVRKNRPIYKLIKNGQTFYMPSLAFAGFMKYMGNDNNITIKNNKIYYMGRIIPIDSQGIVNISRHKAGRNYTYIPISKILLNEGRVKDLKPEFFKDKIVIIGKTAAGGSVDLSSLTNPYYTSPEANAVALDNYINDSIPGRNKFISEVPKWAQTLLTIAACIIAGLIGWYSKNTFVSLISGFLTILIYVCVSFWLFANPQSRLFLPIIVPLYYLTVTSGIVFAFKLTKEMNKKAKIMDMFGKFVSPNVLTKVLKSPEKLELKNTKKCITVLFCDVKDFSRLSERYEPEKLVESLNELFKEIVNIIFENNGTVDKFIGDCIMAYWGDLDDSENHAYMAVKTALEIKKKINELKIKNSKENKIAFDVKIGINTGDAILGLAGTEKITSYTAMGDAVNVASKLEASCSALGRDILMAKSTYKDVKNKIIVIEVGEIQVKGKYRKVEAYEPIGFTKSVTDENEKLKTELITDKK